MLINWLLLPLIWAFEKFISISLPSAFYSLYTDFSNGLFSLADSVPWVPFVPYDQIYRSLQLLFFVFVGALGYMAIRLIIRLLLGR